MIPIHVSWENVVRLHFTTRPCDSRQHVPAEEERVLIHPSNAEKSWVNMVSRTVFVHLSATDGRVLYDDGMVSIPTPLGSVTLLAGDKPS